MAKLAGAQRKLKHKTVGSNNYRKQQRKIAKLHKHVANQRLDNLHKLSTAITKRYDVVCIEDLSVNGMLAAHNYKAYHRSTYDNGWYMFTQMLEYKLRRRGGYLVRVDKAYPSSQTCNCCGNVNPQLKDDRIRKWTCPACNTNHDRDINAAVNIRNAGLRILRAVA